MFAPKDFANLLFNFCKREKSRKSAQVVATNSLGYDDQIEFFLLENMAEAEQEVNHHKNRVEGVFFTSCKLSRGLDMKFGADSLVICLDFADKQKNGNLKYTDILQQIGRSSRTRELS